jgi:hypothetical protein
VVELVVIVVLFVAAAVLVTVELRIMRKPAAQRSEREKRFIASDRKFGKAYKSVVTRVAPIVAIVLFVFLLAVTIPFWARGDLSAAITFTVIGVLGIAGTLVVRRFAAVQRTPAWRERQDAAQSVADEKGHPRFFISGKAGIGLGIGFTALGAISLVVQVVLGGSPSDIVLAGLILLVGILALVAANAQRRSDGSR